MTEPRRRPPSKQPAPIAKWLPAIAAVAVLVVVIVAGASSGKDKSSLGSHADAGSAGSAPGSTTAGTDAVATSSTTAEEAAAAGYDVTGLTVPASTMPAVGTETTMVPVAKTTFDRTLMVGEYGDDVKQLQTRLSQLGFAPGGADGAFGALTQQAVWAYDKLVLKIPRDKVDQSAKVTNDVWQGMQDPIVIQPRRPGSGTHVEIYLPEQVAAVFTDNKPTLIIHIASGTAVTPDRTKDNSWCETLPIDTDANGNPITPPKMEALCGVSYTPGGVFRFTREVTGHHVGALGGMDNPIYFNYGIAMHGAMKVPLEPASHGCIRMNETISKTFQSFVHIRDYVYVWGQDGKEPEQYTKKQSTPVFNYPDPDATTTTSTTTTVKATTTTTKADTSTTTTVKSAATTTTAATPAATTTTVKATPTTPASTAPPTTPVPTLPPTTAATVPPTTAAEAPSNTLKT
ncbi:MAG: hypothetical protein JWM34_3014 [Ilumatobacteraceae bacterium]|nr:hypothetical protein [Ilumatobacteraceae bacterium]